MRSVLSMRCTRVLRALLLSRRGRRGILKMKGSIVHCIRYQDLMGCLLEQQSDRTGANEPAEKELVDSITTMRFSPKPTPPQIAAGTVVLSDS